MKMSQMPPRKCTLRFEFDKSTRNVQPSSLEIHEWIVHVIGITTDHVHTAYYDTELYCFFVKLLNPVFLEKILQKHGGKADYRHRDGSVSTVLISNADIEYKNVRVFNLPPEVDNCYLRDVLSKYGQVKQIRNERWSSQHLLQCYNGVRSVEMHIKVNIPSHIVVCGYKGQVIYTGQTATCYICNESGHLRQDCPRKVFVLKTSLQQRKKLTLADLMTGNQAITDAATTSVIDMHDVTPPPPVNVQENTSLNNSEFPPLRRKDVTDPAPLTSVAPVASNKRRRTSDEDHTGENGSRTEREIKQDTCKLVSDTTVLRPEIDTSNEPAPESMENDESATSAPQIEEESSLQETESQVQSPQQAGPACTPATAKHNKEASARQQSPPSRRSTENKQEQLNSVDIPAESDSDHGRGERPKCPSPITATDVVEHQPDADVSLTPPTPPSAAEFINSGRRRRIKVHPNVDVVRKKDKNKDTAAQGDRSKPTEGCVDSPMDCFDDAEDKQQH